LTTEFDSSKLLRKFDYNPAPPRGRTGSDVARELYNRRNMSICVDRIFRLKSIHSSCDEQIIKLVLCQLTPRRSCPHRHAADHCHTSFALHSIDCQRPKIAPENPEPSR
jgi:hypothetical protein